MLNIHVNKYIYSIYWILLKTIQFLDEAYVHGLGG